MFTNQEALELRKALMAFARSAPDNDAATFPSLYDKWIVGERVEPGDRRYYEPNKKLYKVNKGMGHTTQADWTPDKAPALWTVIDVDHAGTASDPIPASRGMEYTYGLYYLDGEDGNTYLCSRTGTQTGETVVLQYLPHELVGQYFELA